MTRIAHGIRPAQELMQPLEAVEQDKRVRPDHGGASGTGDRNQDDHDRGDISDGTSHCIEPAGKSGGSEIDPGDQFSAELGRGRQIDHTKGGMKIKLQAVTDTIGRPSNVFRGIDPPDEFLFPRTHVCRAGQ